MNSIIHIKLTSVHTKCSKRSKGTSWQEGVTSWPENRYELTQNDTSWLTYEMTRYELASCRLCCYSHDKVNNTRHRIWRELTDKRGDKVRKIWRAFWRAANNSLEPMTYTKFLKLRKVPAHRRVILFRHSLFRKMQCVFATQPIA